ncbi:MAG: aminotransferase class I/II-fold pyridoxal phosphate-dependent enzyme [Armatimonadetes bacterium]|nr:aminotransferase class I/II-fold pyridoxal phosphate-dependent enzyme [Armatimonadota bacterium]
MADTRKIERSPLVLPRAAAALEPRGQVNRTVAAMPPSGIRRFFDLVATLDDVISLGVGEPDFVTPWHIREAAVWAIEHGYTTYTSNAGLIKLRERIAADIHADYGVAYQARDEVLVTVGVSEAMDLALRAVLEPGDEVLIPEPCYVSYIPCTILAGGVPVPVPTDSLHDFKVQASDLEARITGRTRALILSYPNNPTGATISHAELLPIAEVCERHGLLVISDEVYAHLTYEGEHCCVPSLPGMRERAILLNGFSKAYAMTGWRLGYACGPADIIQAMTKIHQYTMLCAPITAQMAAIEALKEGERQRDEMVLQYDQRRRVIISGLNRIGLPCFPARGAFYVFPSIAGTGMDCETFAERLLAEERVAVVPGSAFGAGGDAHIRCAYAASLNNIEEALRRMERFVRRL